MQLMILLTADYASVEPSTKKLNILGAFSRIYTGGEFPITWKRMALVVKIRAELSDHHDERTFTIEMIDADGNVLFYFSSPFRFPMPGNGLFGEFNAILELNELKFPDEGVYDFVVKVDNEELGSTSIQVVKQQPKLSG